MSADRTPGQGKELTDRDRYPFPFEFYDLLRRGLKIDIEQIGEIFKAAGYLVNLEKGRISVSSEPYDGRDPHPQLITLNQ